MSSKVLIIPTGGLRREGITSSILAIVRNMPRDGIEFHIAAVYNNESDVLEEFRTLGCAVIETPDRRKDTVRYALSLLSLMRRERYDVVHVHGSSSVMAIELRVAQFAGIKNRIAHSHNTKSDDPKRDRLLRPVFRRSWTKALACGIDAGKWLFETAPFEVIHNGQELSSFAFDEKKRKVMRQALGVEDALAIGFVGNINYVKNQRFLVEVFKEIRNRDIDAKLFIVGDGPDRQEIEQLIRDFSIQEHVLVTGRVSNVSDYLNAMDEMVLPSLFEGLPNVVLEWQASGLPCLVSDVVTRECAVSTLVRFLSLGKGPGAWADCILQDFAISSRKERKAKSNEAIILLRDEGFDIETTAQRMRSLYLRGE